MVWRSTIIAQRTALRSTLSNERIPRCALCVRVACSNGLHPQSILQSRLHIMADLIEESKASLNEFTLFLKEMRTILLNVVQHIEQSHGNAAKRQGYKSTTLHAIFIREKGKPYMHACFFTEKVCSISFFFSDNHHSRSSPRIWKRQT